MTGARRVLVADPDEDVRSQVRMTLEDEDRTVLEAIDTDTAIQEVASSRPDVILLAVDLPGAGGLRLARSLKAQPETSSAMVVLLFDKADPIDEQEARQLGVDGLLARPFTSFALLKKLEDAGDRS